MSRLVRDNCDCENVCIWVKYVAVPMSWAFYRHSTASLRTLDTLFLTICLESDSQMDWTDLLLMEELEEIVKGSPKLT